jgi:hypothetical protein
MAPLQGIPASWMNVDHSYTVRHPHERPRRKCWIREVADFGFLGAVRAAQ